VTEPSSPQQPFWRTKRLHEMTTAEWESLCDGCARCCLVKFEDEDTAEIHYTDVRCRLLDGDTCRCIDYPNRARKVPDCVKLTPEQVSSLGWLPPTCAYRLLDEGRDLPWWHPLVSGDPATVVAAGISVAGRTSASEDELSLEQQTERVVGWPKRWPKAARRNAGPVS
jgi:uncharacterized cysteine cluster protein YcgN (CxxCxxCC family)